jgi:hypothetical protein
MDISILDSVEGIGADRFNGLDPGCGALCCHGRTVIRENDGRWRARYLRCVDDRGELAAVIPLYTSPATTWSDPAYNPDSWDFDGGQAAGLTPATAMLVGGRSDLRSSLHVRPDLLGSPQLRRVLAYLSSLAAGEGRGLVLPYLPWSAREALGRAGDERIAWALLGRTAWLRGVARPDWRARLGSHARATLRKDERLFESVQMRVAMPAWAEVEDLACAMFAEHNVGLGSPDHPEIARLRNRELLESGEVELVLFTCATPRVFAMVGGLVWNGELVLHELGIRGAGHDRERLAVYLNLVFHESVRYARSRGLRDVMLGMKASAPKSSRGCVFEDVYGGVLGVEDTEKLAGLLAAA